ncbi:Flagellar L-ring protein precursor [Croceibacterium atlanticum]|uniref:Flagellar L-ring protein n=3 Tax=Croceibacterium atlanticum TaxID=1267766 RepID=A0A0F7KUZ6_9SPHN|nr:Flagellar L-ring protein precursor [Croceibacterium atlanticum]
MMTVKFTRIAALLGATTLLGACGAERPAGFTASLPPAPVAAPAPGNGAIFQAAGGYAPYYAGARAHQVGDLVTVALIERTTTSKSASSSNSRDGGFALTPPTTGPLSFDPSKLNSSASSSFNGGGDAAQSSSLAGTITVTIAEVRPNGTALIRGEKVMNFSQGDEWIQLSGIIRLADIGPDNMIASQRIADAQLRYAGKGAVQQSSRQGWLLNFFNKISPF